MINDNYLLIFRLEPIRGSLLSLFFDVSNKLSAYYLVPISHYCLSLSFKFQVYELVGVPELYYAGSHGMDIMVPVKHSMSVDGHSPYVRSTDKQVRMLLFLMLLAVFWILTLKTCM